MQKDLNLSNMSKVEIISKDLQNKLTIEVRGYVHHNGDDEDLALLDCNVSFVNTSGIQTSLNFELYNFMIVQAAEKYINTRSVSLVVGYENEELTSAFISFLKNKGHELQLDITLNDDVDSLIKIKSHFPLEYMQRENFIKFIFELVEKYPDRSEHDSYRNSAQVSLNAFKKLINDHSNYL